MCACMYGIKTETKTRALEMEKIPSFTSPKASKTLEMQSGIWSSQILKGIYRRRIWGAGPLCSVVDNRPPPPPPRYACLVDSHGPKESHRRQGSYGERGWGYNHIFGPSVGFSLLLINEPSGETHADTCQSSTLPSPGCTARLCNVYKALTGS